MGLLDGLARRFILRPTRCKIDDVHLSRQEIRVLIALEDHETLAMGVLAERLVVSLSRLTALIDRLVQKDLIERQRSAHDRRVVRVGLTDRGRQQREHGRQARLGMAEAMLAVLDDRERRRFLVLMRKIGSRARTSM